MNIYNFNYPVFIKDLLICNSFKKKIIKKNVKKINSLIDKELGDFFKEICKQTGNTKYKILQATVKKNELLENIIQGEKVFGFIYYIKNTKNSTKIKINNPAHPRLTSEEIEVSPLNGRCIVFHGILPLSLLNNKDKNTWILRGALEITK